MKILRTTNKADVEMYTKKEKKNLPCSSPGILSSKDCQPLLLQHADAS